VSKLLEKVLTLSYIQQVDEVVKGGVNIHCSKTAYFLSPQISHCKQSQPGRFSGLQAGCQNNLLKKMNNIQPHNKSETDGIITRATNTLGKALAQTPPIIYAGVAGLTVLGMVAIYGLSVIKSFDCGGSLSFKSSQTIQEFQFQKESCKSSSNVTK
jgi:hypothetical protein